MKQEQGETKQSTTTQVAQEIPTKTKVLLVGLMATAFIGGGLFAAATLQLPIGKFPVNKPKPIPIPLSLPQAFISTYYNPINAHVRAGSTGVTFGHIKLDAMYDNLNLDKLTLYVEDGGLLGTAIGNYQDITRVYIYNGSTLLASNTIPSTGKYTFSFNNGTLVIPDSTSKILTIKADIGTINQNLDNSPATPAADIRFGIGGVNGIQFTGQHSNLVAQETYWGATTSAMIINKTIPSVIYSNIQDRLGADATLAAGSHNIFAFNVAADPAGDVLLYRSTFSIAAGGGANITVRACSLRDAEGNIVGAAANPIPISGNSSYLTYVFDNPSISVGNTKEALAVPAGSAQTYTLNCNISNVGPGDFLAISLLGDTASSTPAESLGTPDSIGQNKADAWTALDQGNFVWSDNFKNRGLAADGANATAYGQWYNGYLISGLPPYDQFSTTTPYVIGFPS